MSEAISRVFAADGGIPNSRLPLLLWKGRAPRSKDRGRDICLLYERNGWAGMWVYHVFPYWHFHTRGHEVLTCVAGGAQIGLGGPRGIVVDVEPGDVTIIPAGVGHISLSSTPDFLMAGAYPPGQQGNIVRPGELDAETIKREIAETSLPVTDPISGFADGVVAKWRGAALQR